MDPRERLASNIRAQRLAKDMSQEELAWECEMHPTEISRLERNVRDPRFTTLVRIAKALRIRPAELLRGIR